MVTPDETENAHNSDLSLKTLLDGFFDGTKHMCNFADEIMIPQLETLLQTTDRERAIRAAYYRMILVMRSIVALNNVQHFQVVASATRLLFELHLDIKTLSGDPTDEAAKRYFEFVEIERYRSAEQVVRFASKNPKTLRDISPQLTYYSDSERKKRVEASMRTGKNGKLIYPQHWTGKSVRERAQRLGFEGLVR